MFIPLLIVLAVAVLAVFAAPLRHKAWAALAVVAAGCGTAAVAAVGVLWNGPRCFAAFRTPLFGTERLAMDRLSALFVLMIAVGSVAAVLYSRGYLKHYLAQRSPAHISLHYTALALLALSMTGVVCASGGYSFLLLWELMTVASFLLILFDAQRPEVLRAALTYLILMHIGFALLVAGFVVLYRTTGSADFAALGRYFALEHPLPLFLLFTAGFGMKAGLFPLHVWLPEAHPAAPSHVSALMSGVMIKTGVYGILRVAAALPAGEALFGAGAVLLGLGAVTGLWGAILAALQNDVKRLLAYSSIENVGVILTGVGIGVLGRYYGSDAVALCGLTGALLHTLNHSFFKTLLFFTAGNLYSEAHTTALDAFGGVARQMPLTATLGLLATAAICALPPLNGFVSEFILYAGMLEGIAGGAAILLCAGGMIALALIGGVVVLAFTKLYGIVFLGAPRTHEVAEMREVDALRLGAMAIPAAGILFVGLLPQTAGGAVSGVAADLLAMAPSAARSLADGLFLGPLTTAAAAGWGVVLLAGGLYALKCRALRRRSVSTGPTWGCGFTAPNVRMQYTGESFAEGLESIARPLTQDTIDGKAVAKSEIFPSEHNFRIRHKDKFDRLFAAWWMELLHQANIRMMRLRTGKINHYVLFALLFFVLVFLCSTLNLIG